MGEGIFDDWSEESMDAEFLAEERVKDIRHIRSVVLANKEAGRCIYSGLDNEEIDLWREHTGAGGT